MFKSQGSVLDTDNTDEVEKTSFWKNEKARWVSVAILTLIVALFSFFGPDIHSEAENAPTFFSDLLTTLLFSILFASVLLPVKLSAKFHPNNILVTVGLLIMCVRLVQLIAGVGSSIAGGSNFLALIGIGVFVAVIAIQTIKLKQGKFLEVSNANKSESNSGRLKGLRFLGFVYLFAWINLGILLIETVFIIISSLGIVQISKIPKLAFLPTVLLVVLAPVILIIAMRYRCPKCNEYCTIQKGKKLSPKFEPFAGLTGWSATVARVIFQKKFKCMFCNYSTDLG